MEVTLRDPGRPGPLRDLTSGVPLAAGALTWYVTGPSGAPGPVLDYAAAAPSGTVGAVYKRLIFCQLRSG